MHGGPEHRDCPELSLFETSADFHRGSDPSTKHEAFISSSVRKLLGVLSAFEIQERKIL